MNTIGKILTLTTFGESHGPAMGGVLDGMPAGVDIDLDKLQRFVDRRRTGQTPGSSTRGEKDRVEVLSGIWEGKTLGTPIGFLVRNTDARSGDYEDIARCYRPNHADYTWEAKYGVRDPRGGGRASARETVARVVAGAIAIQALERLGITVSAQVVQVADTRVEEEFVDKIVQAASEGDTLGGIISCVVKGVPVGLGEPVFGKLHAQLAAAMMSIPSVHGFEYGDGFEMATKRGSEVMDVFEKRDDGSVGTQTNHSGGIQGGISNGEDITMRIAFKPVPTLMREMPSIDKDGNSETLQPRGRHDACVLQRAVPIVEAMAALIILDNYLIKKTNVL
ncbi:MAG: chorismate synthase [Muribaculaceae bacterium]|nr:chorismate synthase [Muribaculaceae bacterium]MBQ7205730.1 chorismate synthase [Muribaculaceae bacterium]